MSARASDLLDCYLGGTEENIARLFARAEAEHAILFIDEVDSFLQDRRGARNSWEVTQVNELLVQMDAFPGLFVCATNLVEALDHASMRRFGVKVRFTALTTEQALRALSEVVAVVDRAATRDQLEGMSALTIGDFVAASRRNLLLARTPDCRTFLDALREELQAQGGGSRAPRHIGFMGERR